ncbi:hypothetical protein OIU85_003207 [Salix viminalis]|uniref:Uncharacterized protein n=1 Tax=Salix viminalis TaxID=40686 RepID=A0A9Q0T1C6_SALVM|nr:hypothetical protein OIU85_003207 [Salix viminalis]
MEGIVVGIVGSEGMFGNGGKVTFGRLGMVGKLGSGGNVGLGRDGWVVGRVGMAGKGGNVGLGRDGWVVGRVGMVGKGGTDGSGGNWRRWRAATATLMPEKTKRKGESDDEELERSHGCLCKSFE